MAVGQSRVFRKREEGTRGVGGNTDFKVTEQKKKKTTNQLPKTRTFC